MSAWDGLRESIVSHRAKDESHAVLSVKDIEEFFNRLLMEAEMNDDRSLFRNVGTAAIYTCQKCGGKRSLFTNNLTSTTDNGMVLNGVKYCLCADPVQPSDKKQEG